MARSKAADEPAAVTDIHERRRLTRDLFPDVPENRYWRVTHNPKSQAKPVRLELREYTTERKVESFSRLIGFIDTIASRGQLLSDADTLLARVGDVDDLVGVY